MFRIQAATKTEVLYSTTVSLPLGEAIVYALNWMNTWAAFPIGMTYQWMEETWVTSALKDGEMIKVSVVPHPINLETGPPSSVKVDHKRFMENWEDEVPF